MWLRIFLGPLLGEILPKWKSVASTLPIPHTHKHHFFLTAYTDLKERAPDVYSDTHYLTTYDV